MLPKQQPQIPPIHFLFTILLLYSFSFSHQQVCNPLDYSSLLAFSANISTSSSSPPLNWSSNTNCCQWEGVDCDTNGRVTHLQLPYRGLKGVISSSMGNLVSLSHLDLSNNSITGPIPSTLMNCTNLIDIILRMNHLDGDISKLDFSRLVHLQKLDLAVNNLSGKLPKTIYLCKSLIAVRVASNNLTGQISPKIVNLKSMSFLSLGFNSFMNIRATLLTLANCENLTTLFLGPNFNGESLPSDRNFLHSPGFPKLEFLSLSKCNLTGTFPEWICNLKTLRILLLDTNKIKGKILECVGTLPNLFSLQLNGNVLFGEIPPRLFELPAMVSENVYSKVSHCHCELPVFFKDKQEKSTYRSTLHLQDNALSGHISSKIGKLQSLQDLNLKNNHFFDHIPPSISNLQNLEELDLSKNNLTGRIPDSLGSLHFLSYFNVSYNNLEGPVPSGAQFSTFDESSFEGNPRLCGEFLHQHCSQQSTPKAKDRPVKGSSESKQSFFDGLWVGLASGFSSVLVVATSYFWFNSCMGQSSFLAFVCLMA